jgi:hypothetical protein
MRGPHDAVPARPTVGPVAQMTASNAVALSYSPCCEYCSPYPLEYALRLRVRRQGTLAWWIEWFPSPIGAQKDVVPRQDVEGVSDVDLLRKPEATGEHVLLQSGGGGVRPLRRPRQPCNT